VHAQIIPNLKNVPSKDNRLVAYTIHKNMELTYRMYHL